MMLTHSERRRWDSLRAWMKLVDPSSSDSDILLLAMTRLTPWLRRRAQIRHGNGGRTDMDELFNEALAYVQANHRRGKHRKMNPVEVAQSRRPTVIDE